MKSRATPRKPAPSGAGDNKTTAAPQKAQQQEKRGANTSDLLVTVSFVLVAVIAFAGACGSID